MKVWNEVELQRYIDDEIEESLTLDYKAAEALGRSDGKKHDITKDVSAMANADGGIIIYGLKEQPEKKHVVEKLDPVDRTKFSKEWLDQIISTIRPYIDTVIIHPVNLSTGPSDVAYVVEIPKGQTAHQSTGLRYYRRHNFESVPMEDYEIRDIMNRATVPDASVRFNFERRQSINDRVTYLIQPFIKNSKDFVIKNFKLTIKFPRKGCRTGSIFQKPFNVSLSQHEDGDYLIDYLSTGVLFPKEERNIGPEIGWAYEIDRELHRELTNRETAGEAIELSWTLYADNMVPKQGAYPIQKLHDF